MTRRECISMDFDGCLHEHASYRAEFGQIDVSGIREAHRRGYAVAVVTCNDAHRVAAALRRHGLAVAEDPQMLRFEWHGGADGTTVLVTGRKIHSLVFVDDRLSIRHQFGQS